MRKSKMLFKPQAWLQFNTVLMQHIKLDIARVKGLSTYLFVCFFEDVPKKSATSIAKDTFVFKVGFKAALVKLNITHTHIRHNMAQVVLAKHVQQKQSSVSGHILKEMSGS